MTETKTHFFDDSLMAKLNNIGSIAQHILKTEREREREADNKNKKKENENNKKHKQILTSLLLITKQRE